MSTRPTNIDCDHGGAAASARPVVPVPSNRTAMMVPPELNRPFLSCVAPRKAAAKAGRRYGTPAVGEPLPNVDDKTMPANPAIVAEATSDKKRSLSTLTPARRDASGLNPVA